VRLTRIAIFLFLLSVSFAITIHGQSDKKPKEREEVKGVVIRRDKFRDRKLTAMKPIDFGMGTGGGKIGYIFSMSFGYAVDVDKKVGPVVLFISPGGTGALAGFSERMDPQTGNAYISPDSDVVILINNQRYQLGKVTKDFGLYPSGEWNRSVIVEVPFDVYQAIAHSDGWEMAVGSFEAKIIKRAMNHFREKFVTLESLYRQDIAENK
jgi:hypothetical protein